ncbi:cobalt/nickel transport protein [Stackebrandtia albiflava]|uniref:Cobalt/nickel transport protein n=1 Tax=Stackebrandtia albiflava TaxID=406432 RepID=A0A562URM2_9ACTN|nr:PDGLE domain-containing protein [Stackebrandtia albiflava]TWJ08257.1 cobalt/nickel transport protein [Stackebrandtia albiflava]
MRRTGGFVLTGLVVSLLLAAVVSHFASGAPDGLDTVTLRGCELDAAHEITGGECLARTADEHPVGGPFADYATTGIENGFLSTAVAGALGVLTVFVTGYVLFRSIRRRDTGTDR